MVEIAVRFDRGTLEVSGDKDLVGSLPAILWDPRTHSHRAPAFRWSAITQAASDRSWLISGPLAPTRRALPSPLLRPDLRSYQAEALGAWDAFGQRGVVVLPTGAGKTRVAIGAMASLACHTLILAPTCALVDQWVREIGLYYKGSVGVVSDGVSRLEAITVMTFESASRRIEEYGDRFDLVVVDEAHHFSAAFRAEILESAIAPARLGLSATPPDPGSAAAATLGRVLGPIVCEVELEALTGTHLAPLEKVRLAVQLDAEERRQYDLEYAPFGELARAYRKANPGASWAALAASLNACSEGRLALRGMHRARAIAALPKAKRCLVSALLDQQRERRTLLFAASAVDARRLAEDNLIPLITADTGRLERLDMLTLFRQGKYRALVSARVLNEGIDVPDAEVAILAGGSLGEREKTQRTGRVLRPVQGKTAKVYEIVTAATLDDPYRRGRRGGYAGQ